MSAPLLFGPCQGYGRVADAVVHAYGGRCEHGLPVGHRSRDPRVDPAAMLTPAELTRIVDALGASR